MTDNKQTRKKLERTNNYDIRIENTVHYNYHCWNLNAGIYLESHPNWRIAMVIKDEILDRGDYIFKILNWRMKMKIEFIVIMRLHACGASSISLRSLS